MAVKTRCFLVTLLLLCSQGCFQQYDWGSHSPFEGLIGNQDSNASLRVNISTKMDVIGRLGKPVHSEDTGAYIGYEKYVSSGVGIWWPILIPVHGGSIQPSSDGYSLYLEFGPDSILKRYRTFKQYLDEPWFEDFVAGRESHVWPVHNPTTRAARAMTFE